MAFSFGTSTNPAAPASNAFAWPSSSTSTGNLFGGGAGAPAQTQAQAPAPTTSLFGGQQTTGFGNAQTGTTNLFGASTSQPTTSLFGNTQPAANSVFGNLQAPQPAATTSLFGASQPAAPQPSGGIFGNNATTSNLFGSTTNNLAGSTFGTTASSNIFGSKPAALNMSSSPNTANTDSASIMQSLEQVHAAWNPASPQCRFQHFFYNLVDPAQVHLYGRPPNATNDILWLKAIRENPDPSCMVPALAIGFDDLQKRVDAQGKTAQAHNAKLDEIRTRLAALSQRHLLSTSLRTQKLALQQTLLHQRVLKLLQHLHLLVPSVRASSIRPEEEQLRTQLEAIEEELRKGGIGGLARGKLNELWGLIGALSAMREREGRGGAGGRDVEWKVIDEEGLERITRILFEQQQGLAHLTKILQNDMQDLDVLLSQAQLIAASNPPSMLMR